MPISQFEHLSAEEQEILINAPAYVACLIAGADDKIDHKEKSWATKLVSYRTFTSKPILQPYYQEVEQSFAEALNGLVEMYTESREQGGAAINEELVKLNDILPKLEEEYALALLDSWRSLAKKVAEASGGLMGYASIDMRERALIDLPMITYEAQA